MVATLAQITFLSSQQVLLGSDVLELQSPFLVPPPMNALNPPPSILYLLVFPGTLPASRDSLGQGGSMVVLSVCHMPSVAGTEDRRG